MSEPQRKPCARDPLYGAPPRWSRLYRRHFPVDTDGCSRHARLIADSMRAINSPFRRLMIDGGYEPDHYAVALEFTVKNLWAARAEIRRLKAKCGEV